MQININIHSEEVSRIVHKDLLYTRSVFLEDMEKDNPIFSMNETEDKILILEHIRALDLILDWYRQP